MSPKGTVHQTVMLWGRKQTTPTNTSMSLWSRNNPLKEIAEEIHYLREATAREGPQVTQVQ